MTNLELQVSKDRVNAAYEECRRQRTEHGVASGRYRLALALKNEELQAHIAFVNPMKG